MAVFVAEGDGGAEGAEFGERPLCTVGFEGVVEALTLFVHVLWSRDEDAAMMAEDVLDECATLGFGEMLQHVDQEDEIVGWFEGFDDRLRFADAYLVVDVAVEGCEVIFKGFDAVDAAREMVIIFTTIPEL